MGGKSLGRSRVKPGKNIRMDLEGLGVSMMN